MSFYSCQEERCTRTCFLQYKHTHKQKEDSSKMYINFKEEFSRKEVKNNDDFSLDGGISIGFGIVGGLIVHQLHNPWMLFDTTQRQTI